MNETRMTFIIVYRSEEMSDEDVITGVESKCVSTNNKAINT